MQRSRQACRLSPRHSTRSRSSTRTGSNWPCGTDDDHATASQSLISRGSLSPGSRGIERGRPSPAVLLSGPTEVQERTHRTVSSSLREWRFYRVLAGPRSCGAATSIHVRATARRQAPVDSCAEVECRHVVVPAGNSKRIPRLAAIQRRHRSMAAVVHSGGPPLDSFVGRRRNILLHRRPGNPPITANLFSADLRRDLLRDRLVWTSPSGVQG